MAVRVSRLLHAGYLFEAEGARIVCDPLFENPFSVNCHSFPAARFEDGFAEGLRPEAIFISHFHDDHCSLESLDRFSRDVPIHLFCRHDELFELIRSLGFRDVRPLEWNRPVRVGPFEVQAWRALDADVDSILSVRAGGAAILNVVDSWIDDEILAELARTPWDLVLWPFQTMRELEALCPSRAEAAVRELPPEWRSQLAVLRPRAIVPSSCQFQFEAWSWLNRFYFPISYARFSQEVGEVLPGVPVFRLDPGQALDVTEGLARRAPPLAGLVLEDGSEPDYEFDEEAGLPTTAELATRFAPLTTAEEEVLEKFLGGVLESRWARLALWEDGYFSRPRRWRLVIHDHHGRARTLDTLIEGASLARGDSGPVDWRTEVIAKKLVGALDRGETLSSLYARIEPPAREAVDLFEDPLLRVLYEGRPFAYQQAQLQKILGRAGATVEISP